MENQYYNSKALKEEDPKGALESFQKVLDLEGSDKGEWGFKALKQMIKINFKLVTIYYEFRVWIFFNKCKVNIKGNMGHNEQLKRVIKILLTYTRN